MNLTKADKLIDAFEFLDDKYIDEADPGKAKPFRALRRRIVIRRLTLAACLCLIVALTVSLLLPMLIMIAPPIYKNAAFTAEEIGTLFDTDKDYNGATSSYTKIYAPSAEYLGLTELPTDEYIVIYEEKSSYNLLNKLEFAFFAMPVIERLSLEAGAEIPDYKIVRNDDWYEVSIHALGKYSVIANQSKKSNVISISSFSSVNMTGEMSLGGVKIEIDQTMSDSEIIDSLGDIKEKVFALFGTEYSDIKIIRDYDSNSEYGVEWLDVYFYNEDDHPLNSLQETPVSDYICLQFDNFENWKDDVVSDKILSNVSIYCEQKRTDAKRTFVPIKKVKMLTLEEAEELLYKGYVFGGHTCPICMAAQDKVNFRGYDHVDMTYIGGVPFYRFFKEIGKSENGNITYAMTYVPAVEVDGYREYFEKQKEGHQ